MSATKKDFCLYCKKDTEHRVEYQNGQCVKKVCSKCGSDNTPIQGFSPNLM